MAHLVQKAEYINPFQCFGVYLVLQGFFFFSILGMNKGMEPGEIQNIYDLMEPEEKDLDKESQKSMSGHQQEDGSLLDGQKRKTKC